MADGPGGEKTEQATPKRKQDERKKGNVFSSNDLVTAFYILIAFFTLKICGNLIYSTLSESLVFWFDMSSQVTSFSEEFLREALIHAMKTIIIATAPIFAVGILVPILVTGAQTRFIISKESLKPKFSRLNPLSGLKKLVSLRAIVELVKNLIKLAVITAIIYTQIKGRITEIVKLFDVDVKVAILYTCSAVFSSVLTIAIIFLFIGVFDYFYQWWEYQKNLKMTKQEVKEEYKQMEGDPEIKGQIKQKQREMSQARMMQEVPKADVIIRNPTHFAIAIKYDAEKNRAPVVLAKGMDNVALKIIEIAREHNIIEQENKPLARALYDAVNIGQEIPEEFYQPVAEVLAFVYELKKKQY